MFFFTFEHWECETLVAQDDEHDMDVDTATSATQVSSKHALPELEIYSYLLVLIFLIDQKKYNEVNHYTCHYMWVLYFKKKKK